MLHAKFGYRVPGACIASVAERIQAYCPVVAVGLLVCGCGTKPELPEERRSGYVCETSMPLVGDRVLRQQFSVTLNPHDMRIELKQSTPGDALLETYPYTRIDEDRVEGKNVRGLVATLTAAPAKLEMRLSDSGPAISGVCTIKT